MTTDSSCGRTAWSSLPEHLAVDHVAAAHLLAVNHLGQMLALFLDRSETGKDVAPVDVSC